MPLEKSPVRPYPPVAGRQIGSRRERYQNEDWEIGIFGDLGDKQNDLQMQLIDVPRNSSGTIYFDSGGGSAYAGLALASLIRMRGLKAVGIVAGECSSAAILPLAACQQRFVTPHSTLLFHPIRWQSEEEIRLEEATEWARHFELLEKDLDQLLSRLLDCPLEQLTQWTRPGRFVSGQEFVDAGLAKMIDLFSGDVEDQINHESHV